MVGAFDGTGGCMLAMSARVELYPGQEAWTHGRGSCRIMGRWKEQEEEDPGAELGAEGAGQRRIWL